MRRFLIASALTLSLALPAAAQDAKPAAPKPPPSPPRPSPALPRAKPTRRSTRSASSSRATSRASSSPPPSSRSSSRAWPTASSASPPKVDLETYGPKLNDLAKSRLAAVAAAEKKSGAAFLEKEAAQPGAKKQPSGFVYKETKAGTGATPKATDTVKVHYKGTLTDGTVFDSSIDRKEPAVFPLNGVIPCWTQGVQLMKEGGSARLVCPSELAYGDEGRPPRIKGGATLVFEVQLLSIEKNAPPAAAAPAPKK